MTQDLVKAIHIAITKAVWIATFQLFYYCHYCTGIQIVTLNEKISHVLQ